MVVYIFITLQSDLGHVHDAGVARALLLSGGFTMCRGCFSQLILRDEFTSGGIAGLLGKAAGMPTRRAFMGPKQRRATGGIRSWGASSRSEV